MTLTVVGLFSGIGAHHSALDRIGKKTGLDFTYYQCEIDPYAIRAYELIHGPTPNLGDITKLERLPRCDICVASPPCQDISMANNSRSGNAKGSGTRSALVWDVLRILHATPEEDRPRILIFEEVASMINSKNEPVFKQIYFDLESMGYGINYTILNSKDYGIPQNRRRLFMICCKGGKLLSFPAAKGCTKTLADFLDKDVPQKYYLSKTRVAGLLESSKKESERGNGFKFALTSGGGIAHTITTLEGGRKTSTFVWCKNGNHKNR